MEIIVSEYRPAIPIFQGDQMRLGILQFDQPIFLAPMSGITDYPFRRIAKEHGCSLVFTEMVSAEGLLRKGKSLLKIVEDEHPVSVQLFGSNPEVLAEAAQMAESAGADVIDINMGCPADQVIEAGAGVDLMRFPEKVKEILTKVRSKVKSALTIKIRSGWDKENINAVEISKIAESCGVDAISIHPRTKVQGFRGRADWSLIGEVRRTIHIPVIGNGDVTTPLLAKKMLEETGCDGVMIGRGALGNPWIFGFKNSMPLEGEPAIPPSLEERKNMIHHHFLLTQTHYGEKWAVKKIRKHVYWYTKGLPCCAFFHSKLSGLREKEALFEVIHSYFDFVQGRNPCQSFQPMESGSVTGRGEKVF
jgi:tRNA-dihydrouridine synthase B